MKNSFSPRDLFTKISIQTKNERGYPEPIFVIHTKYLDKTSELLRIFHLSPWPLSIPMMHKLPLPDGYKIPSGGDLVIDWSLDDPRPDSIINNVVIPRKLHNELAQANFESKAFTVILEEEQGLFGKTRTELIPGVYESYLLDWTGVLGHILYARRGWRDVSKDRVENLLNALIMRLEQHGPATGLYTEMGYLYRLNENWDLATIFYLEEIKFGLKPNGWPSIGSTKAFGNLGVLFKKFQDNTRALDCFTIALTLNPNFFEGLISITGLIEDEKVGFKCLSRAYRIRPNDPRLPSAFESAAIALGQPMGDVYRVVQKLSSQMDITKPLEELKPKKPISTLVRRLLNSKIDL